MEIGQLHAGKMTIDRHLCVCGLSRASVLEIWTGFMLQWVLTIGKFRQLDRVGTVSSSVFCCQG